MRGPSARPFWAHRAPKTSHKSKIRTPAWVQAIRVHLMVCAAALAFDWILHLSWLFYFAAGGAAWDIVMRLLLSAHMWKAGGRIAELRRRRYQGMATWLERHRLMSLAAMRKRARFTRPVTDARRLPPAEVGVHVGAKAGRLAHRALMGSWEDFYLVFAGPRSGKTGWMANVVLDAPGAVVTTSTRADVLAHTILARQETGPVYVLNPAGDAGVISTLLWNMVDGCDDPDTAISRAGYLVAAAPKDSSGRDAWWDHQGGELLRLMLHAAALVSADMMVVKAWAANPADPEPLEILEYNSRAASGWAAELAKIVTQAGNDPEFMQNISRVADTALSWLASPEMQRIACPPPGEEFSAAQFILAGGTLYMIGAHRPHSTLTPYFTCLVMEIYNTAKQIAAASPGLRLDPPLLMAIDEPSLCFRGPLDQMSAEAGGHGITVVTGFQSFAQPTQVWGEHGGKIIRDNASIKLYFGGITDTAELKALSDLCGPIDSWHYVHSPEGKHKMPVQIPLLSEARLRTLPPGQAVMLHRTGRPVITQVAAVWKRKGYQPANLADYVWAADEDEMIGLEAEHERIN